MSDSLSTSNVCRVCGAAVVPGAPLGQCPKCLIKLGLLDEALNETEPKADEPRSANRFGDYVLERQIGRGAMGVVFEARHLHLRRSVAIKVILDSEMASAVSLRRFHIEAEAAAKLDHPHIVPIYEVGERDGQPYLCMKLVHGENLHVRIGRGDYGPGKAAVGAGRNSWADRQMSLARLMAKVARAVQHAHQNKVLHRDLKPGNILIDDQGEPYLTDFGLAKILEEERAEGTPPSPTATDVILGTLAYMSPEQAASEKLTTATDIYGIGAILYELLTGRVPFHGNTPLETMRLAKELPPRRPRLENPAVHPDLETICLKCLEKSPVARYATAEAVAEDLERWLRREPIKARPAGPWLHAQRWVKRNPVGAALILSLCLGLGATLFLLNLANRRQNAAIEAKRLAESGRNSVKQQVVNKIRSEWSDTNIMTISISSELLAVLGYFKQPDLPPWKSVRRLTFAINITEEPVELATGYVPFLKHLENDLGNRLNQPVLFDLILCKQVAQEYDAITEGKADFQRMGGLPYVLAKANNPGVQAVIREDIGKQAVIYVRRDFYDRGVTNLSGLAGHSFAFGGPNSTVSLMAQIWLARAGVDGTKLSRWKSFAQYDADDLKTFARVEAKVGGSFEVPIVHSHQLALRAVKGGKFDAGVARREYFERGNRKGGLVELYHYDIPGDVYVASAELDPAVVNAFRECLLGLNDPEMLSNMPLQPLTKFLPTSDAEYMILRSALTNEALRFEVPSVNQSGK